MRTQLVATNKKQRNKMMIILIGVIVLLLLLLSGCSGNKLTGEWEAYTTEGHPINVTIKNKTMQIESNGNKQELDCIHKKDSQNRPMIEAEKDGVLIMASLTDIAENAKDEMLYLLISNDGGHTSQEIIGKRKGGNGISFFQVLIFGIVGLAVATYMNGRKKLKEQENAKEEQYLLKDIKTSKKRNRKGGRGRNTHKNKGKD